MIDGKELRIGNWYNFANPMEGGKLSPTKFESWQEYIDFEAYGEPIPVTSKILLSCGFEKLPGSKDVYRIISNDLEISFNTKLKYAYIDCMWGQASIKRPIFKHLHQIQNLIFSLTQTELEYKP